MCLPENADNYSMSAFATHCTNATDYITLLYTMTLPAAINLKTPACNDYHDTFA